METNNQNFSTINTEIIYELGCATWSLHCRYIPVKYPNTPLPLRAVKPLVLLHHPQSPQFSESLSMEAAAVPRIVYCGPEPIRFSVSSRRSFISPRSKRSRRILAVATDPKPTQTSPPKSTTVNGSSSSSSSASKGVNNNVSTVRFYFYFLPSFCYGWIKQFSRNFRLDCVIYNFEFWVCGNITEN